MQTVRVWDTQTTDDSTLWKISPDGWIKYGSDPLMWIPSNCRSTLWGPHNLAVMAQKSTKIDISNAVLGEKWAEGLVDYFQET